MKHSKVLANQKIIRRYQHRSWYLMVILIFIAAGAIVFATTPKVISPCASTGCQIAHVYEKESKTQLEEMISYIVKTFEPEGSLVVFQALEVAQCESHWNPQAYNYNTNLTGDYGLFQINTVHIVRYGSGFMYDWKTNVDVAYKIYKSSGWNPWVCWKLL